MGAIENIATAPFIVGRGPVPRQRSRAQGSVGQDRLILTRSGSGDPELQRRKHGPSPACVLDQSNDRGGQAPALRKKTVLKPSRGTGPRTTKKITPPLNVGRGTGPRQRACSSTPTIAGDRPPHYEKITPFFHRRARDRPSPCVLVSDRITPVGQDRLKLWHLCQAILNCL